MNYLGAVLVGSGIGYFTNWLAIKMLFRPLEEKRILGFKVPFTPGLIPKEKDRIAKNIGRTVNDYLLSPEAIIKSVNVNKLDKIIQKEIYAKLEEAKIKKTTLNSIIEKLNKGELEENILKFQNKTYNFLINKIIDFKIAGKLKKILEDYIQKNKVGITEKIDIFIEEFIISEEFKEAFNETSEKGFKKLKEKSKLKNILPEGTIEKTFKILDENQKLISYKLLQVVKKEEFKRKFKLGIKNIIENNFNSMLLAFVPLETLTDKIYLGINNYLKTEDASKDINNIIKLIILEFIDQDINKWEFIDRLMDQRRIEDYLINLISRSIEDFKLGEQILNKLEKINSSKYEEELDRLIINFLKSDTFKAIYFNKLNNYKIKILNLEIMDILNKLNFNYKGISFKISNRIISILEEKLPLYFDKLGIDRIVEITIKEFDDEFTEQLILDIAEKELRAITILGGFLGGFIGLLSLVF